MDEGQGTREQVRVSYEKLSDVAKLASSERYQRVISQVREELARAEGDLPRRVRDLSAAPMRVSYGHLSAHLL